MRNLTKAEAEARAALLDITSYAVELDLTTGAETFASTTVVRFSSRPGSTFLELDAELVEGTLDGRPLEQRGNRLALEGLGGEHEVRVVARGRYTRTGEGLHRFVDPADERVYVYMQAFLDDAQRVYACFDQPDLKAVFQLSVRAPIGDMVRSNARGELRDGVHVFAATPPMSTYMLTLAAGQWHGVVEDDAGVELGVWCRQSMAAHLDAAELLRATRDCFAYQQRRFGSPYPFGDSYDQVFCPEFNAGAMENPGMVTFADDRFLFRSRRTVASHRQRGSVIAHEMAHMWFGDQVTMRWWDGIWLNESFAEFMGMTTVDEALEWDGAWVDFGLGRKAWGYRADQLPTTHPVDADVPDSRAALLNFDGISYAKGASVLRQLSAFVGEEVFVQGLRTYLARHAYGNADLADLLAALEAASGRDLGAWAQSWLRTSGVNTLRPVWQDGTLVVEQTGGVLREHVIQIGAYDGTGGVLRLRESRRVELAGARTTVPGLAAADLLLVNDGDLTFAKVRFDDRSRETVLSSLAAVADPMARAVCWGALWDAARDAELAARDLVAAVLAGVGAESDPSVVATLLAQAVTAASSYAPTAEQRGLLDAIAGSCWDAAVEPGSDLQLVRLRAAVSATADADRLRTLLSGDVPGGIVLDAELRWHLVRRAAALGVLDDDGVSEELARDRTAAGVLQAEAARAALPTAAAKARAWASVTTAEPTAAQVRFVGEGFWQVGQDEVLRPYVQAYLAALPGWWAGGSAQISSSATSALFPSTQVTADVVGQVRAVLARPDLPDGMRRLLLEEADDLARALRARDAAGG